MGIDPGSLSCGYGIVTGGQRGDFAYIASGTISMSERKPLHIRLRELYDGLSSIIMKYRPTDAAVEKIFFAKSIRAALSLGYARGIALLALAEGGINLHEYSALEVKKAVTGYGRAEKRQVGEMVKAIIGNPTIRLLSSDESDALALAICHMNSSKLAEAIERSL
jgi:crossover junction endodeoxyribonuclease RuvC